MCIKKINDEEVTTIEKENLSEFNAIVTPEGVTVEPFTSQYEAENAEFLAKYDTDEKQINYYTQEMYNLLDDFQIDYGFTEDGCRANVKEWYYEKKPLFNLLRKHPMWDERAKAIVFLKTENRGIDIYKFNDNFDELISFVYDFGKCEIEKKLNNSEVRAKVCSSTHRKLVEIKNVMINNGGAELKQFISEELARYINLIFDKNDGKHLCKAGEKLSRVLNKIFKNMDYTYPSDDSHITEILDATKFKREDRTTSYNKLFAQVSDSINPLKIERITCLSVNILDFLTMSYGNSWSSCHYINSHNYRLNLHDNESSFHGRWKAGTLSYSNDGVSMIFYTLSDKYTGRDYYNEPRINRQIFAYNNGTLMQSRLYPSSDNRELSEQYRPLVQSIIAFCENKPNLWLLNRSNSIVNIYISCNNNSTFFYHDWERSDWRANISHLKDMSWSDIIIGGVSYCVDCGRLKSESNSECENLQCHCCDGKDCHETCHNCGCEINTQRDVYEEINGDFYCNDCYFWCDIHQRYETVCDEYGNNNQNEFVDRNGNRNYCCNEAIEDEDMICCHHCNRYVYSEIATEGENGNYYCETNNYYCLDCYSSLIADREAEAEEDSSDDNSEHESEE